jgi:hypothetical protein
MAGISRVFDSTQPSAANEGAEAKKQAGRVREFIEDFCELVAKASSDIHWEIYRDPNTYEDVLAITALAKGDSHLLRKEVRKPPTPTSQDELMKELCALEVEAGIKTSKGRWY